MHLSRYSFFWIEWFDDIWWFKVCMIICWRHTNYVYILIYIYMCVFFSHIYIYTYVCVIFGRLDWKTAIWSGVILTGIHISTAPAWNWFERGRGTFVFVVLHQLWGKWSNLTYIFPNMSEIIKTRELQSASKIAGGTVFSWHSWIPFPQLFYCRLFQKTIELSWQNKHRNNSSFPKQGQNKTPRSLESLIGAVIKILVGCLLFGIYYGPL